jgi:hypothetical protein
MADSPSSTRGHPREALAAVGPLVSFVGFWAAVGLPVIYIPLFVGGVIAPDPPVFLGIVAVHFLALALGHDRYR